MTDRSVLSDIEITPEMVEAGQRAYSEMDEYLTTEDERYAAIFRAMEAAKISAKA